jgi:hypothetical protein
MAGSLVRTAENRIITSSKLSPDEITISSIVVLLYDAARSLLEALALMKGYKVYNHECFVSFLAEIVKNKEMAFLFNKVRLIRNGINYYGEPITLEEGNLEIQNLNRLIVFTKENLAFC